MHEQSIPADLWHMHTIRWPWTQNWLRHMTSSIERSIELSAQLESSALSGNGWSCSLRATRNLPRNASDRQWRGAY